MNEKNQIRGKMAEFEEINSASQNNSIIERNVEKDAEKVISAILSKRENPRANIYPGRIYYDIASRYNGSRSLLDNTIIRLADNCGLKGIQVMLYLNNAYENFEEQRKAIGDARDYANDLNAVKNALKACNPKGGLEYSIASQTDLKTAREILDTGFFKTAEYKLNVFFAEA